MANRKHLKRLREGVNGWNAWRAVQPSSIVANFSRADLSGANLNGVNLRQVELQEARLSGASLKRADLSEADLTHADLFEANLSGADLSGENLNGVNLCDFKATAVDRGDRGKRGKREFLADVCALANASGGDLILGVKEKEGAADGVPSIEINFRRSVVERCSISEFMTGAIRTLLDSFEMITLHLCAKNMQPSFAGVPMTIAPLPDNYKRAWRVRFAYGSCSADGQFAPCG